MILTRLRLRPVSLPRPVTGRRRISTAKSDPLRILFCGADEFSCAALEALDGERRAGGVVESVDVVVRPGKGVGRGYKTIREGKVLLLLSLLFLVLWWSCWGRLSESGGWLGIPSFLHSLRSSPSGGCRDSTRAIRGELAMIGGKETFSMARSILTTRHSPAKTCGIKARTPHTRAGHLYRI